MLNFFSDAPLVSDALFTEPNKLVLRNNALQSVWAEVRFVHVNFILSVSAPPPNSSKRHCP
jgi:hypothetical protein